jgi:hypothetical protein
VSCQLLFEELVYEVNLPALRRLHFVLQRRLDLERSHKLAGPMQLRVAPNSQNGLMVGDYIATAFTSGVPHGVFAVASDKIEKDRPEKAVPPSKRAAKRSSK